MVRLKFIVVVFFSFSFSFLVYIYSIDYNEETSNRLIYDEERKYGKIPTKIYLLYLKSCGLWTIAVFCGTAFAWQATKIYLDIWLRDWTDIEQTNRFTDVCITFGKLYSDYIRTHARTLNWSNHFKDHAQYFVRFFSLNFLISTRSTLIQQSIYSIFYVATANMSADGAIYVCVSIK